MTSDEAMHEWRKAEKNLWYQMRLLAPTAPSMIGPLIDRLDDLAEALGDDHDLAVLIERLESDPDRFGGEKATSEAIDLARDQQRDLRARAFRLGATVYAESPKAFVRRLHRYWDNARSLGPERRTGGIAELASDHDESAFEAADHSHRRVTTSNGSASSWSPNCPTCPMPAPSSARATSPSTAR